MNGNFVNTQKPEVVDWEYCECGCHGHSLSNSPMERWMYNTLQSAPAFHVYRGHGQYGVCIGKFNTFEEADQFVKNELRPYAQALMEYVTKA